MTLRTHLANNEIQLLIRFVTDILHHISKITQEQEIAMKYSNEYVGTAELLNAMAQIQIPIWSLFCKVHNIYNQYLLLYIIKIEHSNVEKCVIE